MEPFARYLDAPVDYSAEFSDRVAELGRALAETLGVPVRHEEDMNYNAGQALVVYLAADGSPTGDEAAGASALRVWLSARGPLWTVLGARRGDGEREWHIEPDAGPPAGNVLAGIGTRLAAAGLTRVPADILDQPVPGHETELDGMPATVRDVLFCELC
jgi:hypothetical protein